MDKKTEQAKRIDYIFFSSCKVKALLFFYFRQRIFMMIAYEIWHDDLIIHCRQDISCLSLLPLWLKFLVAITVSQLSENPRAVCISANQRKPKNILIQKRFF